MVNKNKPTEVGEWYADCNFLIYEKGLVVNIDGELHEYESDASYIDIKKINGVGLRPDIVRQMSELPLGFWVNMDIYEVGEDVMTFRLLADTPPDPMDEYDINMN